MSLITREFDLVERARRSVCDSDWKIGECADQWMREFARGRTDGEFGLLVGLTGEQVYQRRLVWHRFHEMRYRFPLLLWAHFHAAYSWDDAEANLRWAEENQATVAEMRAWRRANRGEDLTG